VLQDVHSKSPLHMI